MKKRLTLTKALSTGQIDKFVAQEQKRGVKSIASSKFDAALAKIVKPQQSKRQT